MENQRVLWRRPRRGPSPAQHPGTWVAQCVFTSLILREQTQSEWTDRFPEAEPLMPGCRLYYDYGHLCAFDSIMQN